MVGIAGLGYDKAVGSWLPLHGGEHMLTWRSRTPPCFEIYWGRDNTHHYPPHLHDFAELLCVHDGELNVLCRGNTLRLNAGDVYLLRPNELHSTYSAGGGRKVSFTLFHIPAETYWSTFRSLSPEEQILASSPMSVFPADRLEFPLNDFMAALLRVENATDQDAMLRALLANALGCVAERSFVETPSVFAHPAVVRARMLITEQGDEPVSIQALADEVGLNARYFISLFKEGTGLPPHQYQIATRVERARRLIQDTNSALCEVAAAAGFADQSHLNRHFKRSYGFTPKALKHLIQPI